MVHMFQWAERRRSEIAGLMSSVLRAHLHAYDPVFSMTLRYLIRYICDFCCAMIECLCHIPTHLNVCLFLILIVFLQYT